MLEGPSGTFEVRDAQIYAGYVLHIGSMISGGKISVGDKVTSKVLLSDVHIFYHVSI